MDDLTQNIKLFEDQQKHQKCKPLYDYSNLYPYNLLFRS